MIFLTIYRSLILLHFNYRNVVWDTVNRDRTGEDDDGFPEVKLLLGSAMRMSQRLHHPVLERFAIVPERDYLLGFLNLEPPSICTL